MVKLTLKPNGWPVPFREAPPGLFVHCKSNVVGLKSEYGNNEAFCDSGEYFCAKEDEIIPVKAVWEKEEI